MKALFDAETEGAGGDLYKAARALRREQAEKFENRAIVANLIRDKKGMQDPVVAADKVFHASIISRSPEEITFLKNLANASGKKGKEAWREIQGSLVRYIQEEATTKNVGTTATDLGVVSPAKLHQVVRQLDANGRLDIVLGRKKAQIIRDLNDVVKYVATVPPGTLINNSGTAATLLAAIGEAGASGAMFGLPVPVVSLLRALGKKIQNDKLKAKIQHALNVLPTLDRPPPPSTPSMAPPRAPPAAPASAPPVGSCFGSGSCGSSSGSSCINGHPGRH
jgi:hypothetical protein